jgi:hypothetical protein
MLEEVYEARVKKLDDEYVKANAKLKLCLAELDKRLNLQQAEQASVRSEIAASKTHVTWLRVSTSNTCYRRLH